MDSEVRPPRKAARRGLRLALRTTSHLFNTDQRPLLGGEQGQNGKVMEGTVARLVYVARRTLAVSGVGADLVRAICIAVLVLGLIRILGLG